MLADIAGSAGHQRFTLRPEGQTLGSAATAEIVVEDNQESSNGTYANGDYSRRVGEVELVAGLMVSLGHHQGTRFEVAPG